MKGIEEYNAVRICFRKACGTETTRKVYLWRLRAVFEYYNVNPDKVAKNLVCMHACMLFL